MLINDHISQEPMSENELENIVNILVMNEALSK